MVTMKQVLMEEIVTTRVEFNQSYLCSNGYMNVNGNCLGLSIDWLHYKNNHPEKDYITDKYREKCSIAYEHDDNSWVTIEYVDSKNFYNRINFYQKLGNIIVSDYNKKSISTIKILPNEGIIGLVSNKGAHATCYKINFNGLTYNFEYFDPNLGEFTGHEYFSYMQSERELRNFIKYSIAADDLYGDSTFNFNPKYVYCVQKTTDMISYLKQEWDCNKAYIEEMGTYADSPAYAEICEFLI